MVAILADKRQEVKWRTLNLIFYTNGTEKEQNFVLQVNPNAQDHTELINIENELTTLPLLKGPDKLADIEQLPLRFDDIPCHSRAAKQMVALVTQAAELKTGAEAGIEQF